MKRTRQQRTPRRALARLAFVAGGMSAAAGCIARSGDPLLRQTDDDAGGGFPLLDAGAGSGGGGSHIDVPVADPHAVLGVDPPHGPFTGGQQVLVRGNGFSSKVRVWFGPTEVPAADLVAVDPGRVQVKVPPGVAGLVDVSAQNADDASTRRALTLGYSYDAFYADPSSGPTSGGTIITVRGQSTAWTAATKVSVGQKPCPLVAFRSATELTCTVPPGTPGTKQMRVTTADGVSVDVLDAYTYGDSDNGFKGGLSGLALNGTLRVLCLDNYVGVPIAGATVVVGDDLATARVAKSDASGVVFLQGPDLIGPHTVTIAKKCFQPTSFVDVPVDTVTAYLDPVLTPACAGEGDPPPVGGTPGVSASVTGELVWQSVELKRRGWTNVPPPKSDDEKLVAYVLRTTTDPTGQFQLPDASLAVTPDSTGTVGFAFTASAYAGNLTMYALAGIENRALSPPVFTAYAMGVITGVGVKPGGTTNDIFIPVDLPLDHAITIQVTPPGSTVKGPDRIVATATVRVGDQYLLFPNGRQSRLMPASDPVRIVGLPPLIDGLSGATYASTASAGTGPSAGSPRSVVGLVSTTTTSDVVHVDGFVEIPRLIDPGVDGAWNGRTLDLDWKPGGTAADLVVLDLESAGALVDWSVAVPGAQKHIRLPDLGALGPDLGMLHGPVSITVTLAHIAVFDYGSLRYRQLTTRGWDAYARDVFFVSY